MLDLHHGVVLGVRRIAAVEQDAVAVGSLKPAPLQTPESDMSRDLETRRLELRFRSRDVGDPECERRRRERREFVVDASAAS